MTLSSQKQSQPTRAYTANQKRSKAQAILLTHIEQDGTPPSTAGRWELVPEAIIRGQTGASAGTLMDGSWPPIGASRCVLGLNSPGSSIAAALSEAWAVESGNRFCSAAIH